MSILGLLVVFVLVNLGFFIKNLLPLWKCNVWSGWCCLEFNFTWDHLPYRAKSKISNMPIQRRKEPFLLDGNTGQISVPKEVWPSRATIWFCTGAFPIQMSPLSWRLRLEKVWSCWMSNATRSLSDMDVCWRPPPVIPPETQPGLNAPIV